MSDTKTKRVCLYLRQSGTDAKPKRVLIDSETEDAWTAGATSYPKATWEKVTAPPRARKKTADPRPEDLPEPPRLPAEEESPKADEPIVSEDAEDMLTMSMSGARDEATYVEPVNYSTFIINKSQLDGDFGFEPLWIPDCMYDFQAHMTDWAIRGGRKALFEDCGLGKTLQELVWAQNVLMHTNRPTLIITAAAVAYQFPPEGEKFGVEVKRIRDGKLHHGCVNVTNYEQLHKLNPDDFAGVACDESSILKNASGETRKAVTEFLRRMRYRLLGTATAAPNDLPELGTSSEALGYLGHMDMLNRFFVNDRNNSVDTGGKWRGHAAPRAYMGPQWRFRGHAEVPFWRWVCSWARSMRKPSDFGFEDREFVLPPLIERGHEVSSSKAPPGMLFSIGARGRREELTERRRTIRERCEMAAALVADTGKPSISWCHLNDEGDLLEELIPGAVQVSGGDSDEEKEEKLVAFQSGHVTKLVIKPVIGAWGLNLQMCDHMTSFASHSHEQDYQCVRRCYRFGQKNTVTVDRIFSDGERRVMQNLKRKAEMADTMFENLVRYMRDAMHIQRGRVFTQEVELPSWL